MLCKDIEKMSEARFAQEVSPAFCATFELDDSTPIFVRSQAAFFTLSLI